MNERTIVRHRQPGIVGIGGQCFTVRKPQQAVILLVSRSRLKGLLWLRAMLPILL